MPEITFVLDTGREKLERIDEILKKVEAEKAADVQRVNEIVDRGRRFLVATHVDPDGDALGSAFASCLALTHWVRTRRSSEDKIPYRYQFLPKPAAILKELPKAGYDTAMVVDCGDLRRVGEGHDALKKWRTSSISIIIKRTRPSAISTSWTGRPRRLRRYFT